MKFFSLSALLQKAKETFTRFPFPLFTAIIGTGVAIMLINEVTAGNENFFLQHLLMSLYLLLLFSISSSLYAERFTFSAAKKNFMFLFSVALALGYYFSLPNEFNVISGMRFALFTAGLHLLVAFSPFLVRGEMNGLWQFNKSLFIRILTSGLYSAVLFGGLALAMLAVEKLFDLSIHGKYYAYLWVIIAGIFNTWFFLAGIPENLPSLEDVTDYPKGLKIFTVYVLLPLITIYLVILYLYAGKILITANWPVGWVGYMVIAFSIFGILSFLLIYPLRDDEQNPWVKFFSRLFYFLLIPPIVLLYVAILKRINMYGITEERYFVLVLALWLSFIALYFIFTNGKNIRIIPVTLCVITFLSSFGPWGAFDVSHNSQLRELTLLLDSNHVLKDGRVDSTKTHDVKSKDYDRIESIVRYINNVHGHTKLQNYFSQNLDSLIDEDKKNNSSSRGENNVLIDLFKLNKIESADDNSSLRYYRIRDKVMLSSGGYDFVKDFNLYSYNDNLKLNLFFETDSVHLEYTDKGKITLTCKDFEPLVMDVNEMLKALPPSARDEIPPDHLTLETDNRQWKAKIIFTSLNCNRDDGITGALKFSNANGILMVRINNAEENEVGEKEIKP